jgi:SAM domain (Sterile alpha motif)
MDISAWLRGLGLERYEQAFRENAIDEAILPKLTAEDFRDLGVTAVGHRRILLDAIAALRAEAFRDTTEHSIGPDHSAGKAPEAERRQLTGSPTSSVPRQCLRGSIQRNCAISSAPITAVAPR